MSFYEKLLEIMKTNFPINTIIAKVISVDRENKTIDALDLVNDIELYNVKLQSSTSESGIVIYPAKNSVVFISLINNDERNNYISGYSDVDGIELRGNQFGGLVKINELKKQINKNSSSIQALMDAINAQPAITEPGNGAPSALQIAIKAKIVGKSTADLSDIENKEVQHG